MTLSKEAKKEIATRKVRRRYEKLKAAIKEFYATKCAYCDLYYDDVDSDGCGACPLADETFCNNDENIDDNDEACYVAISDAENAVDRLLGLIDEKG